MPRARWATIVLAGGLAAIAAVTYVSHAWLGLTNPTIAALIFLLIVFVVAASAPLWVPLATSVVAILAFNYFFLPPVGTWTIADPQNWVALATLLAVSVAVSHLSSVARTREQEAVARRDETTRLFDFSRDVLLITEDRSTLTALAASLVRRFGLEGTVIALPREVAWERHDAGAAPLTVGDDVLQDAFASADTVLEFDARARTYIGQRTVEIDGGPVRLVPIRLGTRPIGVLGIRGDSLDPGPLDALAGLVAIAVERASHFEAKRQAEVTRQSEALKSALLSSLAHDLRTPLTAIRVAADNLQASWLQDAERQEQGQLIQGEVERLNRLFENILEMARIDAGGIVSAPAWVHPSQIVADARALVEPMLCGREIRMHADPDRPVQVDPRLTATALAHLLENAAQYSPADRPIEIDVATRPPGLSMSVRDYGPGISSQDLARVFDPFYRGTTARKRPAGSGMGLAIARGLLAAEGGRVWAENCPDGGARFSVVIEAEAR